MSKELLTRSKSPVEAGKPRPPTNILQRKCACGASAGQEGECEECKKKYLQRRAAGAGPETAPPVVHEVLRSPGQPLDPATRNFFEPRFGHDFSKVRVHTDAKAAESARSVNALAYTAGSDLVFGEGQFTPGAEIGRRLIAHELTHVVQQQQAPVSGNLRIAPAIGAPEREAEETAVRLSGSGFGAQQQFSSLRVGAQIQRQLIPVEGSPVPIAGPYTGNQPFPAPPPPPAPDDTGCCCCADDLQIYDPLEYEWPADPELGEPFPLSGHIFTTKIKLSYKGAGKKKSCKLQWWEKTDRPYILVDKPNTWTNLSGNPRAKSISDWGKRKEPCPGEEPVRMVDSPGLGIMASTQNQSRTLEFRIGVDSGQGCSVCGNSSKKVSAKQFIKIVNGKMDKKASYFKTPNPDEKDWK